MDPKYEDYRDITQREKTEYNNNKLDMLSVHEKFSKLDLFDTQKDFDATSLYPSDMWDKSKCILKIQTGFGFKPHMNDVFLEAFNIQTFNQDGKESATLQRKNYN